MQPQSNSKQPLKYTFYSEGKVITSEKFHTFVHGYGITHIMYNQQNEPSNGFKLENYDINIRGTISIENLDFDFSSLTNNKQQYECLLFSGGKEVEKLYWPELPQMHSHCISFEIVPFIRRDYFNSIFKIWYGDFLVRKIGPVA